MISSKPARTSAFVLAALLLASFAPPASATDFDGAQWIWYSPGEETPLASLPAAMCFLRGSLDAPDDLEIASAEIIATCDNLFILYLNGKPIGESLANNNAWGKPRRWDVTELATAGRNTIAVQAVNTLPGPGGLIVKMRLLATDGREFVLATDATWLGASQEHAKWPAPDFDDTHWSFARVVGQYGDGPWNRVAVPNETSAPTAPGGDVLRFANESLRKAAAQQKALFPADREPDADFAWPGAIAFVDGDRTLYRPAGGTGTSLDSLSVTIFNPRKSRAFPEHDLPAPMKVGRYLRLMQPGPNAAPPRVLVDADRGALGSPSASFDGRSILFSMARDDAAFYHVYRVSIADGSIEQLTDGPFHDIDPAELPDGRIVFTSTRIGTFEEYHSPPSRSLFVMDANGRDLEPITNTIIFDNEPEVLADGRIVFIRSDNFFDRGKVETLLHAVHPDGGGGFTEFGLDIAPDYGGRLRSFYCGSPAPMPDGRLAFVSAPGVTIGRLGARADTQLQFRFEAGDVSALPDGRLLCTRGRRLPLPVDLNGEIQTIDDLHYVEIDVLDPSTTAPTLTPVHTSTESALHSPIFVGRRTRPPRMPDRVDPLADERLQPTGVLYCQNARFTQKTTAGWPHIRAIRVLAGRGLTTRSSHSYIVHAGNETIELGTVPLAEDGSFSIEVPADTPIALQAVDAEGRSELNEMSWIYVRPGEQRGCVGCHHKRQSAPLGDAKLPLALKSPPLRLLPNNGSHRFRGNNAAVTGLMEMQFDRYREVAGINRFDDRESPDLTGREEVARLVRVASRGTDPERIAAIQRLALFRDADAVPALAECLQEGPRELRVAAAVALGTCGTRESVPPLLDALTDAEPLVVRAAEMSLENLVGRAITPEDRPDRITDAEWDAIERDLIDRLASGDADAVRRAAVALGHVGGPAAREPLSACLRALREVNPAPEWRKAGHVGDNARFNALDPVNPRTVQAVARAIGRLQDPRAVPLLAETLAMHHSPETGNLFFAEAAAEALGGIATPQSEFALITAFASLEDYPTHTYWYGDHSALMACHAAPVHYHIIAALDAMGSTKTRSIVPHLIRSIPIDPDRALLLENDDYEILTGRVIRRAGAERAVVETCLALLGDDQATPVPDIDAAIRTIHRCWGGHPSPENRAAQLLSVVCRDRTYAPRIRAALARYVETTCDIPRVFDTGIPIVDRLPKKNWVCFYLARTLGVLADVDSAEMLLATLAETPAEAASGRPDPLGPGVLFLHNDLTPCWRAAVVWALGQMGESLPPDTRGEIASELLDIIADLENALDTRHAAAVAIARLGDSSLRSRIETLAEDYPEISVRRALKNASARLE